MKILKQIFFSSSIFLLSCAKVVTPSGGDIDREPPIVKSIYPENKTIRFSEEKIVIVFDEYVRLNNASKEIIISPAITPKPEFQIKKKSIEIKIDLDSLQKNTTYAIHFGKAIVDNNEGNVLENYSYVFSTGEYIDSLAISGIVKDSYLHTPVEGTSVLLYPILEVADTLAFWEQTPVGFTRTKTDGSYLLPYLKPGTYHLLALNDINQDLKYQAASDGVGFLDSTLVTLSSKDSVLQLEPILLFTEAPDSLKLLSKKIIENKRLELVFNTTCKACKVTFQADSLKAVKNVTSAKFDTLKVWVNKKVLDDSIRVNVNDSLSDWETSYTLFLSKTKKKAKKLRISLEEKSLHPSAQVKLLFKEPINVESIPDTLPLFINDSVPLFCQIDTFDEQSITLKIDTIKETNYTLVARDSLFSSIYGDYNDSLNFTFSYKPQNSFGNLSVVLKGFTGKKGFFLLEAKGVNEVINLSSETNSLLFEKRKPSSFTLKFIEDIDGNEMFSTGKLGDLLQPEPVLIYPEEIKLRANWDLDLEWDINIKTKETKEKTPSKKVLID